MTASTNDDTARRNGMVSKTQELIVEITEALRKIQLWEVVDVSTVGVLVKKRFCIDIPSRSTVQLT